MENTANRGTVAMRIVHRNPKNQPIGGWASNVAPNSDHLNHHIDHLERFIERVKEMAAGKSHPDDVIWYGELCLKKISLLSLDDTFREYFNKTVSQ